MAQNVELKARCRDMQAARCVCRALGAKYLGADRQIDTYFHVPKGRFKLRESRVDVSSLIYYEREDDLAARQSHYVLVPILDHTPDWMNLFKEALGIRVQVEKTREVYLFHNTRIHLDDVVGLGTFIEFEFLVDGGHTAEHGAKWLDTLSRHFDIQDRDLVTVSYGDLMLRARKSAAQ